MHPICRHDEVRFACAPAFHPLTWPSKKYVAWRITRHPITLVFVASHHPGLRRQAGLSTYAGRAWLLLPVPTTATATSDSLRSEEEGVRR